MTGWVGVQTVGRVRLVPASDVVRLVCAYRTAGGQIVGTGHWCYLRFAGIELLREHELAGP
jgi:hypothetical protein